MNEGGNRSEIPAIEVWWRQAIRALEFRSPYTFVCVYIYMYMYVSRLRLGISDERWVWGSDGGWGLGFQCREREIVVWFRVFLIFF